jgi:hypothetical protein
MCQVHGELLLFPYYSLALFLWLCSGGFDILYVALYNLCDMYYRERLIRKVPVEALFLVYI